MDKVYVLQRNKNTGDSLMIQCDECGKMVRGKTPQWVIDQDLVYTCQECVEKECKQH